MTPTQLSDAVSSAVAGAVQAGDLDVEAPSSVLVERPRVKEHGDYATNIALQLAKKAGLAPRAVAELLAQRLRATDGISEVDVAGPGFLNIRLESGALGLLAGEIVAAGRAFGTASTSAGEKVNLEFVSANPTGPLHLGGTRWAAVGDALARVLTSQGAEVTREYYFNDHGSQIDRFARSLLACAQGEPVPEDGYAGAYIDEIVQQVLAVRPDALTADDPKEVFRSVGVDLMFTQVKQSLHDFGVDFDVFFHEDSLHESGAVDKAVARLDELGHMYDKDGARWLRTTDFGDDKDRVVIKSDGDPAYISGDLAYYLDKRSRGFDRCVIMLGNDHHGYIGRMMAMCSAFGDTPGVNLEILIGQQVNLLRDGEPLRMSKRNGTVLTLEDLVDAIGVDAGRYALARSSSDSVIDIDLGLWTSRSNDNPVFYVQYAHARLSKLLRDAADRGIEVGEPDLTLLATEAENNLLRALGEYPRVVAAAAELRSPHRVARYLEELAGTYHRFYDACRVLPGVGDDGEPEPPTELGRARLVLCDATRVVLANGLGLLGVGAPERM